VRHWGYAVDRAEYAHWLWQCDVVVSTARHEFFGLAVAEALACGCLPVLPEALAYPELIPAAWPRRCSTPPSMACWRG
jgi:glycosyltransferase involved in cell wall biosynthesis